MKNFSFLFVFSFLINGYLFSQCAPYEQGVPLAPSNTINYWDWRNDGLSSRDALLDGTGAYKFWYKLNGTRTLFLNTSPFIATQQPNTGAFVFDQDYSPEDGWELVYRHFGEAIPDPDGNYTSNPAFALYNRRSGLLRIFIMPTYNPTAQTAAIEVWFNNTNDSKKSAILSFGTDYPAAIEKFDNDIRMNSLNQALGCNAPDCDTWYYGDFMLAYDPCICRNFSQLNFRIKMVTTSTATSKTEGSATNVISAGTLQSNAPKTLIGTASKLYEGYQAGMETSKKASEFADKADAFIADNVEFLANNNLLSATSYKSISKILKAAPKIGMAIGLARFFYTTFLGSSMVGATPYAPQTFRILLNTQTIETTELYPGFNKFTVPGTSLESGVATTGYSKPHYDKIPGVVSLLNTPKLEYVEYRGQQVKIGETPNMPPLSPSPIMATPAPVREYHLKEDLKLVVNPASGLEITKVEACFFWDESKSIPKDKNINFSPTFRPIRHFGPFLVPELPLTEALPAPSQTCQSGNPIDPLVGIDKTKLVEITENHGYEVFMMKKGTSTHPNLDRYFLNNISYKTPNVDILYLKNQTFKLFHNGIVPFITLRINIFLRNKEDLGDKKVYVQTLTYRVLPEDISISPLHSGVLSYQTEDFEYCVTTPYANPENKIYYDYKVTGIDPSPFANTFQNIPVNIILKNQVVSTNILAVSSITIKGGTSFNASASNPILIKAPEIEVEPGVEIPPFVTLEAGYPLLANSNNFLASAGEIYSICTSNHYVSRAAAREAVVSFDHLPQPPINSNSTLGYPIPNPTRGECSLSFNLAEEGGYAIQLSNILGETVGVLAKSEFAKTGPQSITFDTDGLEAGVYFITFTAQGFRQARKLVVVR